MLGAVDRLVAAGFEVDARGCRQMAEGVKLLAARERRDALPGIVVVALGTNWIVTTAQIRQALRILGPGRVLGLVVPRELASVRTPNRRNIRAAGRRWPDRVKVLDWVRYSAGRASWFAGDGLHLAPAGARAFTRLLSTAFEWTVSARDRHLDAHPGAARPPRASAHRDRAVLPPRRPAPGRRRVA